MDVDRYITDEAVEQAYDIDNCAEPAAALRAALPAILAQHRVDVLREAADRVHEDQPAPGLDCDDYLRKLADEAVPE